MQIPILPPDINESFSQFTVIKGREGEDTSFQRAREFSGENSLGSSAVACGVPSEGVSSPSSIPPVSPDRIRFGLITIKNFGQGIATAIIEERKKNGKFKSLSDFLDRVKDKNLNKKSLEALIKSGALDSFGIDRGVLLGNVEILLEYNKEKGKQSDNQDSLFGLMTDTSSIPTLRLTEIPNADMRDKLAWEKELLGLYISGHPLDRYKDIILKKDIDIKKALENKKEGESVVIAIIITDIRTIQTKNNETMAFLTIADFSSSSPAVIFPRVYKEFRELIFVDSCIAIKGIVYLRNGEKGFTIERMKKLT